MATLSVWKFDSPDGAANAESALEVLSKQELVTIHDAATVSWEQGKNKPKTKQRTSATGIGALGGAFWGFLFGLIFFVPLLGAALGAGFGALGGSLTDVGIDDDFIGSVRSNVVPGTSALFILTSDAVVDKIRASLESQGIHGTLLQTNLSANQEEALRHAFGQDA
ncbi:membrane protein of uknown function UCP014873 [Beutenbergia cavernae DSM 12333]|uniref:Membrane protein of uknown function UCP014873 n=1 Tax=Beutenbergia cavernae (strain ATCC BAA-8 / DSM 12333 / CCUG 43141 / JCM 11478 / NBRC 16432 / NCIMB 13614 / HKI 0122) TaxID=471853 RepID=C5BYR2_BEUC1|nr:DUF1269 domain-containing protein [Beutenbergia cavernae]ACQ79020.1 membrane protein of uknown function UCP014873 [Beutenbergia cavernae DSM 12333]